MAKSGKKGYFTSTVKQDKEKFYNLVMFPYPSGRHIGHEEYSIGDVIALNHLQGFVLNPDALLPPASAAIEIKAILPPDLKILIMKSQLKN